MLRSVAAQTCTAIRGRETAAGRRGLCSTDCVTHWQCEARRQIICLVQRGPERCASRTMLKQTLPPSHASGPQSFFLPRTKQHVRSGGSQPRPYRATCSGDVNSITVGENTNLQDGVVVHVAKTALGDPSPTTIGSNVSVGAPSPSPLARSPPAARRGRPRTNTRLSVAALNPVGSTLTCLVN